MADKSPAFLYQNPSGGTTQCEASPCGMRRRYSLSDKNVRRYRSYLLFLCRVTNARFPSQPSV